jgi:integrase
LSRAAKGVRMFEPSDIHALLNKANATLKAIVLLGINCGFGNSDIATLSLTALDLEGKWVNFPRPKTGVTRRCPLWPETIEALRKAMAIRPKPSNEAHASLVFFTRYGMPWVRVALEHGGNSPDDDTNVEITWHDAISKRMRKLLKDLGLKRPGLGFYALRHTFETVGGEAKDQVAVNAIMGHIDNTMAAAYRERISDDRLRAVTEHVRAWLFGTPAASVEQPPVAL